MPLEHDIVRWIKQEFSPQDADTAIALLEASGKSGRMARCVVLVAAGDLEMLRRNILLAEQDYRDVIMAAEYDKMQRRERDLSASFLVDSPVKMWISSVARTLQQREYFLTSLETTPTGKAITCFLDGLGEGTATFEGDLGKITIAKQQGQWTLEGNRTDLELYGLSEAFTDEGKFRDAVSCYILAKRKPNKSLKTNDG